MEYVLLEPIRRGLNVAIAISPALGIAMLPVLLAVSVIAAGVICLFLFEFSKLEIKSRLAARFCLLLMYGWVLLPLHLMK
jgi:hypothetical protein